MLGISDDSTNSDSAVLAVARLLQQRLDTAPLYGGEIDELLKSFALLLIVYVSEARPKLTHALERAQNAPLPTEVLDELMACGAKIDEDRMSTFRGVVDLGAAGGAQEQIVRRLIAGIEHMVDAARALTRRTQRLLEEFE